MTISEADLIRARRAWISTRRAELADEDQKLADEDQELVGVQRVLARLQADRAWAQTHGLSPAQAKDAQAPSEPEQADVVEEDEGSERSRSTKPEGTPSLFEMTEIILAEQEQGGRNELEGSFIMNQIQARWWPEARTNSVLPSLWRFAKQGRLVKNGSRYSRVKATEPSDASAQDGSVGPEDDHQSSAGLFHYPVP